MDLQLQDHVAVIIGGAGGIGRAAAVSFAQEGARVAIWDCDPHLETTAAEMAQAAAATIHAVSTDVCREDSIASALESTCQEFGRIDHLVHCAAVGSGKFGFPFTNLQPEDWSRVLEVNVLGMVRAAHAVAPVMVRQKHGTMVFLGSVAGQIGSPTDPPYSASKAANINFAQCLARDLADHGIRVNVVCPGMVKTPLNQSVWKAWADKQTEESRLPYESWAEEKIRRLVPLGRWQEPEDVADMIVFLSSGRAAEVTGQTINVDGGFVMHW